MSIAGVRVVEFGLIEPDSTDRALQGTRGSPKKFGWGRIALKRELYSH